MKFRFVYIRDAYIGIPDKNLVAMLKKERMKKIYV